MNYWDKSNENHFFNRGLSNAKRKFKEVHGDAYEYDWSTYIVKTSINKKIKMRHRECGYEFWQSINNHRKGQGCPNCKKSTLRKLKAKGKERFIEQSQKRYGNIFDFSRLEYVNQDTEVQIKCLIENHGWFFVTPKAHFRGRGGCPKCYGSWGEKFITDILERLKVYYIKQKTFNDCRDKRKLRFDFYLEKSMLL